MQWHFDDICYKPIHSAIKGLECYHLTGQRYHFGDEL